MAFRYPHDRYSRRLQALDRLAAGSPAADASDVDAAIEAAGWSTTTADDDRIRIVDAAPDRNGGSDEPGSPWDRECDRILGEIRAAVEPLGWDAEWSDDDIVVEPRGGAR